MKHRAALLLISLVSIPGTAAANGRFPDAQQLVVNPGDPSDILVQTTYGFIRTRNGGTNWTWTCESAASYGGVLDPAVAMLDGGVMIAGVFDGLVVAEPDGCAMGLVGALDGRFVVDVSRLKSDPVRAIALSSDGLGGNQFDTRVWETVDTGGSWSALGTSLPTDFLAFTLDAAPANESVIYLSGFRVLSSTMYEGTLVVSEDGGETWSSNVIPGSTNGAGPYIAAIDPSDADTVYVRLASLAGSLLVTHDAGVSWDVIFEGEGALQAFALSPDGGEVQVGGPDDGVWSSPTDRFAFEKKHDFAARCLTWTEDALFVCGREALDEFTIGRSIDGGETFEPIHHLFCLEGPEAACPGDSQVVQECAGPWAAQKDILLTEMCEDALGAGGSSEAGGAGDGAPLQPEEAGCGCSLRPARRTSLLSVLAVATLLAMRRRRESKERRMQS